MYELKMYREVMCHDNEEWCKTEKLTGRFKIDTTIWQFWPEHSNVWKICTLMVSFWPKYIMSELKKHRIVMFDLQAEK